MSARGALFVPIPNVDERPGSEYQQEEDAARNIERAGDQQVEETRGKAPQPNEQKEETDKRGVCKSMLLRHLEARDSSPGIILPAARGRWSGLDLVPSWGTGPEGEIDNGQPDDELVRCFRRSGRVRTWAL